MSEPGSPSSARSSNRPVDNNSEKVFITEQDLILDSFRLGRQIFDSGFRPDFIAGIWRGGSTVGIVVQECLQYLGVSTDHISIRTSYRGLPSYSKMIKNADKIRVHGLDYLEDRLDAGHKLLLVDDVYSSGYSIQAVKNKLRRKLRQNTPEDTRTAVVWYRPVESISGSGSAAPEYFINRTDRWLVLPYELAGLGLEELKQNKSWVMPMLNQALSARDGFAE